LIKELLDRNADPNRQIKAPTEVHRANHALWLDEEGATPLLRASQFGDLTLVRLLLDNGADPSIPTFDKTTPLMVASGLGWAPGLTFEYSEDETFELVKLLVDKGGVVTAVNDHGHSALHGAAYKGANKVVQFLVEHGADMALQDKGEDFGFGVGTPKMTPLDWAAGVPVNQMTSPVFHEDTVALLMNLMKERGVPIQFHNPEFNNLNLAQKSLAP
jgi:ankyrin repeat protein